MLIKRWVKTRNSYVWDVRLLDENGKKRLYPTGHTSKRLAQEYEAKLRNEIAERKRFPERFLPQKKFSEFVPEYLEKHASRKRSYRDYLSISKKLLSYFDNLFLHEINRYHVASYYSDRSKSVGVAMVNREVTILKGILTKAIEWGFLKDNPVKGFKLEKEKPRGRFLRDFEAAKLIEACNSPHSPYLKPMVIIDLHTGLRKEELLSLKWDDVYLERSLLKVEDGKGGYTRHVDINETAMIQFLILLDKRRGKYVFHDAYGRQLKDTKKSFSAALERAGLDDVRFHDLRRTFATNCALKNIAPKTLQKWMGHKDINTTMKYYVVSPEEYEKEAIKRLDEVRDSRTDTPKKEGAEHKAQPLDFNGAGDGTRTRDLLITNQLLYQLSYAGLSDENKLLPKPEEKVKRF